MSKRIPLSKGKFAIVDDEDFERVNQFKWGLLQGRYAQRNASAKNPYGRMHRFILQAPPELNVDHINGNGLDNRKCNLRLCTQAQNVQNSKMPKTNVSGFKGVSQVKSGNWRAQISVDNTSKALGTFKTKEEAARAYDRAALEYYGEFARLNFPRKKVSNG